MPVSVTMPRLGESVTEGTVTRWLKQEGDRVEVDEPLLEVSTDKVDTEIPSPAAGVLARIVVGEDETAEVGSELAVIAGDGEDVGTAGSRTAQPSTQDTPAAAAPAPPTTPAAAQPPEPAPPQPQPQPGRRHPAPAQAPAPAAPAAPAGSATGTPVKMPALGESVTEGTVTRWLKQVGDTVEVDEPLLEVSTDKVDTEIPSPVAGTVLEIKVAEDETVPVGADLAIIGVAGRGAAGHPDPARTRSRRPRPRRHLRHRRLHRHRRHRHLRHRPRLQPLHRLPLRRRRLPQPLPRNRRRPRHQGQVPLGWPRRRRLRDAAGAQARHRAGVDLRDLAGTGVGGRIRKQDVLDAAARATAAKAAAPAPAAAAAQPGARQAPAASALRGRTEKLSRLRAVIAKRMVESLQVSAQLTTVVEVDVTRIAKLRDQAKADFQARHGVKLSFLPFFALATVEALQQHPTVNASIDMEAGHGHLPRRRAPRHRGRHRARPGRAGRSATPATSTSPGWPSASPTWPSAPAPTRSARTSCPAARSR